LPFCGLCVKFIDGTADFWVELDKIDEAEDIFPQRGRS
jgi:hypothetical protein